jgi:hypothetical protein
MEQTPKTPPTVKKLEAETVAMRQLGASTLSIPIPAEHLRIHRAAIARAAAQKGSLSA